MELGQLRTFLAVVEHGSFSRAGQALRLGQSTVSFHIRALEDAAGATLLDRRGRGVRVTAAGASLRKYALRIVSLHDEAVASVRESEEGHAGSITIAASTVPGEHLLPPILAAFRKTHPAVEIAVNVSDSTRALASLLAQDCDLALVGAREADRRIVFTAFAEDEIVLAGPPGAPARVTADELAALPLVVREEGSGTRTAAAGLVADRTRAPLLAGSATLALRCVAEGVGYSYVSRLAAASAIRAGEIRVVKAPGTPVRRKFHAARLANTTPSGPVRELLSMIVHKNR